MKTEGTDESQTLWAFFLLLFFECCWRACVCVRLAGASLQPTSSSHPRTPDGRVCTHFPAVSAQGWIRGSSRISLASCRVLRPSRCLWRATSREHTLSAHQAQHQVSIRVGHSRQPCLFVVGEPVRTRACYSRDSTPMVTTKAHSSCVDVCR